MEYIQINNERMKKCIRCNKHALVGYITAGYPNKEAFLEIVKECCRRGLSILEIGFPSANPYEDGKVIQNAHKQVGIELGFDMDFWRRLRGEVDVPIWLMGYYNDLMQDGIYRRMAEENLYDALVISDVDSSVRINLKKELEKYNIDVVGFVSNDDSFHEVAENNKEFKLIYQRLYTGPTGVKNNATDYKELLDYNQKIYKNVVFGGFGISTTDRVEELLCGGFFGAIIGTEMMRKLNSSQDALYCFIEELSGILREVDG